MLNAAPLNPLSMLLITGMAAYAKGRLALYPDCAPAGLSLLTYA